MKKAFRVSFLCALVFIAFPSLANEQDNIQRQGNTLEHRETVPNIARLQSIEKGQLLAHDADLFEAFEKSEGLSDINPDDLASFDEPLDSDDL